MGLETPEKIRELQRKLYRKAKQDKEYRFYLLFDKIYRTDILSHAFNLVKAQEVFDISDSPNYHSRHTG